MGIQCSDAMAGEALKIKAPNSAPMSAPKILLSMLLHVSFVDVYMLYMTICQGFQTQKIRPMLSERINLV